MVFPADMEPEAKNLIDRMLDLNPITRFGSGFPNSSENGLLAVKKHPFFEGIDFASLYKQKVPVPPSLMNSMNKSGTIKRVNLVHSVSANEKPPVRELRKGLLKKKNEWYMQQVRTFVLTSEPKLKYYKHGTELRVRLFDMVY